MTFVRPWLLVGVLGALLPLAIHLAGRRRAPRVQFTALRFVMDRHPGRARWARLEQHLLLGLRMAVAALIAVALAKPMIPSWTPQARAVAGSAPVALVIVIDDSMSMATRDAGGPTRLARARARARALIAQLPLGSSAAIVASGRPARALEPTLRTELDEVRADVGRLQESARPDDPERALTLARRLLAGSPLTDRRVVLLSDLSRASWASVAPGPLRPGEPPVIAEVIAAGPAHNVGVVGAVARPAPDRGPQHVRVTVRLRNDGRRLFAGHVTVRAGERELKRWVELAPGRTLERSFVLPAVVDTARVSLPPDDLDADNRRDVLLGGGDRLRVALIDGSPRPVPRQDEVFFIERALRAGAPRAGAVSVDTLQLSAIDPEILGRYDIAVLANVAELPRDLERALVRRLHDGLGVLVSAGDGAGEPAANWLASLMPWRVAGVRPVPARLRRAPFRLGPVLAPGTAALRRTLAGVALPGIAGAEILRQLLVQPRSVSPGDPLITTADGAPLLLRRRIGRGLVALWTSTLDRDWSDIPLEPGFVPLVGALCEHLAGRAPGGSRSVLEPGDTTELARHRNATTLELRAAPDPPLDSSEGGELLRTLTAISRPGERWRVRAPLRPGRYRVIERGADATWSRRTLVVVPPASESARPDPDDPARWSRPLAPASTSRHARVPGWPLAFAMLLALLALEGVVLWRSSRGLACTETHAG